MRIWVINPYDELPNATDVPLRYWTICKALAKAGHQVTWWSSDFSHLTKTHRTPCQPVDGFHIEQVPTPAYQKNVSWKRLRNHQIFARSFYRLAREGILKQRLQAPHRMVVSLPPLETFAAASSLKKEFGGEIALDIMDAWPEVFYQLLPSSLSRTLGPLFFRRWLNLARNAYGKADRISAVGYAYLQRAALSHGQDLPDRSDLLSSTHPESLTYHLCYHGVDLTRFPTNQDQARKSTAKIALYTGALEKGYDLKTLLQVARRWEDDKHSDWVLHIAGKGTQETELKNYARQLWQDTPPTRLHWHGYLQSGELNKLLQSATVGIIPNRSSSLVACPYKMGEYCGAGLPIVSCLTGESTALLKDGRAGLTYQENHPNDLLCCFDQLQKNQDLLQELAHNSRRLAENIFDRQKTYAKWVRFIEADETNPARKKRTDDQ